MVTNTKTELSPSDLQRIARSTAQEIDVLLDIKQHVDSYEASVPAKMGRFARGLLRKQALGTSASSLILSEAFRDHSFHAPEGTVFRFMTHSLGAITHPVDVFSNGRFVADDEPIHKGHALLTDAIYTMPSKGNWVLQTTPIELTERTLDDEDRSTSTVWYSSLPANIVGTGFDLSLLETDEAIAWVKNESGLPIHQSALPVVHPVEPLSRRELTLDLLSRVAA